jgi:hypothetical protein
MTRERKVQEMKLIDLLSTARRVSTAALMIVIVFVSAATPQRKHVVTPVTWPNTPVSTAEMNQRVREAATKFPQYGSVPRIGLFDVAHPADPSEYVDLGGNAVMLVTVVTHYQNELPLKRVYIDWRGNRIELKLITAALSKLTDRQVSQTLGAYRMDALYLVPFFMGFDEAELMADFAVNRTGFRLGTVSGSLLSMEDLAGRDLPKQPGAEVLQRFIQREYPGFAKIIER